MKIICSVISFVAFTLPAVVRADFRSSFASPPYEAGKSVLGLDGWEDRVPNGRDSEGSARVEKLDWNEGKSVLMLRRANLKNDSFDPISGDVVSFSFDLAISSSALARSGRQFRIWVSGVPIGEIYYDSSESGGLGYGGDGDGKSGGTIIVPKSEMLENTLYTISLNIDKRQQRYDISVRGSEKNGPTYKAEGVAFLPTSKAITAIKGVYILSGSGFDVYMGFLAIEEK